MMTKHIAILITLCLFVSLAAAQPYSIRANRGLNLRAAPSLSAAIAATARSGDILQVIGHAGEWLKISHEGREVWLADWVNYSRVDSSAPSESQQPASEIDNCCFVDRQCNSEQQWVDGYWAYQNGQCPAQPQPGTSTQPAASAPANVNNCCFVDRQCSNDQQWEEGYWDYQYGQCTPQPQPSTLALPSASELATGGNCCSHHWQCRFEEERVQGYYAYKINQCAGIPQTSAITLTGPVPRIEGSARFVNHVIASLKLLKGIAPDWYNYVITGMDVIVEVPVPNLGEGQVCTARAYHNERKATLESCWIDLSSRGTDLPPVYDQGDTAVALAHEACHIHTHEEGKHFASQEQEEAECRKFGTGVAALMNGAFAVGMNPRHSTTYFQKDQALRLLRNYCSQGYRTDLFCPTLQRLERDWGNVPYAVFPPGAPQW